jgi:hypothetical protein
MYREMLAANMGRLIARAFSDQGPTGKAFKIFLTRNRPSGGIFLQAIWQRHISPRIQDDSFLEKSL